MRCRENAVCGYVLAHNEAEDDVEDAYVVADNGIRVHLCELVKGSPKGSDCDNAGLMAAIVDGLRKCDFLRSGQPEYSQATLEDPQQGLWDLWEQISARDSECGFMVMDTDNYNPAGRCLYARDPRQDVVKNGLVAIDFGTKSTVVACREPGRAPYVLRLGTKDLTNEFDLSDTENPTILRFVDIPGFARRYQACAGRPYTRWNALTSAQSAYAAFRDLNEGAGYGGFFSQLKQWAAGGVGVVNIADSARHRLQLPPYLALSENVVDPIEIYAYHLGLLINSQQRGKIFLRYVISCPVSFTNDVRKRLVRSFQRGLRKSLPPSVIEGAESHNLFSVSMGPEEPLSFAVSTFQSAQEMTNFSGEVQYGIFDFGGGTTDFDLGVWRSASSDEREAYFCERVIEHRANGGDATLGGENILASLAYAVYRDNKEFLDSESIRVMCPLDQVDTVDRAGGTGSNTTEARCNLQLIAEALRPFYESPDDCSDISMSGSVDVPMLIRQDGNVEMSVHLEIDVERLQKTIEGRIKRGILSFLSLLDRTFGKDDHTHVFLAGNASRGQAVLRLFQEMNAEMMNNALIIHGPQGGVLGDSSRPTAKTGVALGLLSAFDGSVRIIDALKDDAGDEAPFRYYVGKNDGFGVFKSIVERGKSYGTWHLLMKRGVLSSFTLYATEDAAAVGGELRVDDARVKCIPVCLDNISDVAGQWVMVRSVEPTVIQIAFGSKEGEQTSVVQEIDLA